MRGRRVLPGLMVWLQVSAAGTAWAACTVERAVPGEPTLFVRYFSPECTKAERAAQAVPADEILEALKAGKGVSIENAMVSGDLLLTRLPTVPLASVPLPLSVLATMAGSSVTEARVIRGPFLIKDSVFDGLLDTQLKPDMVEHRMLGDMVVFQGPVTFRGTTFTKGVDLSRTIFLGRVDSSAAVFLGDAFFLTCIFDKAASFEKTAFGGITRYYQAVFHQPVTFLRAGFSGLTNFLSVTFKKEASFSRAYFKMGTGFSGSKFEGISDFSEAVFEKNVFFSQAVFVADTYFRRAMFRGEVSFSDAEFKANDDFAKASFQQEPNFTRAKFSTPRSSTGFENPVFLTIVGVALLIFLIAFIVILKKG
ncbi:MAG: hypothetical protein E6K68_06780 [Nitrospirae bacterium]|nr:MAG: hypothetical protein E6K68_06780 [Nitrospirota bacterium]